MKNQHEIRDPIHTFIRLDSEERKVVDSRPFQRLRHIHQLALTYLVYPGATHRRFEHSLGVMELAGRVFDVVTNPDNIHPDVRDIIPGGDQRRYWRRVLRMAALCHDIGHLPFSHAAEKDLLPEGRDHERLGIQIIQGAEMAEIWRSLTPPLDAEHITKLAFGEKKYAQAQFKDWESILSEIIIGDAFGVDRMDYLLRDSHHAGVAYGVFDQHRLIDTLRILPWSNQDDSKEPALGLEIGGLHSAEAMMLARYFMYQQVYFHPVRRIYDIHLKDFLNQWCEGGHLPIDMDKHLEMTDTEIMFAIREAVRSKEHSGHNSAARIANREHFKRLDIPGLPEAKWNLSDSKKPGEVIYADACDRYGEENIRYDSYDKGGKPCDFPVKMRDESIVSSLGISDMLNRIPAFALEFVFVHPEMHEGAREWLNKKFNPNLGGR